MKKKTRVILLITAAVMITLAAASIYYVNDYYKPASEAAAAASVMEEKDGNLFLYGTTDTAIIIYPGGKVDERAYASLATLLHDSGHTVIIAKMPFRLGILGSSRAETIISQNLDITSWYICGHSLGGTAASMYTSGNQDTVSGIIFLGSYPYRDLSDYNGSVLTITAENDQILNQEAFHESLSSYPPQAQFTEIEGGNHAGFGCYGPQQGDGDATISWSAQHQQTADLILDFIADAER